MSLHDISAPVNQAGNFVSVGALLATLLGWLPHIAALLSVVWFGLKIVIALQEWKINKRKLAE